MFPKPRSPGGEALRSDAGDGRARGRQPIRDLALVESPVAEVRTRDGHMPSTACCGKTPRSAPTTRRSDWPGQRGAASAFRLSVWPPTSPKYLVASPSRIEGWQFGVQEYDSRSSPRCTVTSDSLGACTLMRDSASIDPAASSAIMLVTP